MLRHGCEELSQELAHKLVTILGFVRYAATRFTEAKFALGESTRDAVEGEMFLQGALPKDQADWA